MVGIFLVSALSSGIFVNCYAQTGVPGRLVIANQFEHTVLVVDPATHKVLSTVGVDINGHELTASRLTKGVDGIAWIPAEAH